MPGLKTPCSMNIEYQEFHKLQLLKDVAEKLVDGVQATNLNADSAEHWLIQRELQKHGLEREGFYDVAVFMFCRLNQN